MRDISRHEWRLASRFEHPCPGGHFRSANLLVFHPPGASRPCGRWLWSSRPAPHPDSPGVAGELFEDELTTETFLNRKDAEIAKVQRKRSLRPLRLCGWRSWCLRGLVCSFLVVFCGEVARSSFRLSPALGPGGSGLFPLRLIRVFRCPTHCPFFETAKTQRSRSFSNSQVRSGSEKTLCVLCGFAVQLRLGVLVVQTRQG